MLIESVTNKYNLERLVKLAKDYIDFKRAQGRKYKAEEETINRFLRTGDKHNIEDAIIPVSMTKEWFTLRRGEKPATFNNRCCAVRLFLIYASDYGYEVTIPDVPIHRVAAYEPYIFTEAEIERFFFACDTFPHYPGSRRHEIIPVFFRILYGCGLRSSEAGNLKVKDVDLSNGILTVHEPKNQKDRYVPMNESVRGVVEKYFSITHNSHSVSEDFFFVGKFRDFIQRGVVYDWFRQCIEIAGISHHGKGYGPRVHDLRHTFCVHSLKMMSANGDDPYLFLPILSTYIGHTSVRATQQYLRLTADLYPEILTKAARNTSRVIPAIKEEVIRVETK